jgi:hypothetical protein
MKKFLFFTIGLFLFVMILKITSHFFEPNGDENVGVKLSTTPKKESQSQMSESQKPGSSILQKIRIHEEIFELLKAEFPTEYLAHENQLMEVWRESGSSGLNHNAQQLSDSLIDKVISQNRHYLLHAEPEHIREIFQIRAKVLSTLENHSSDCVRYLQGDEISEVRFFTHRELGLQQTEEVQAILVAIVSGRENPDQRLPDKYIDQKDSFREWIEKESVTKEEQIIFVNNQGAASDRCNVHLKFYNFVSNDASEASLAELASVLAR